MQPSILCEHPPTISIGRSGSRAHIAADDEVLRGMGIRVHYVNRGGGCILHLPGQLAAYLLMPLEACGLTLQAYVDRLHDTIEQILTEFDLTGATRPDVPGVFSGMSRIATVGIAVNRWIAYHGLTLNVGPYLELFDLLDEPGIGRASLRQTSMESRRQRRHADAQGARGIDPQGRVGLRAGAPPPLHASSPDPPEGPHACLCSQSWMSRRTPATGGEEATPLRAA